MRQATFALLTACAYASLLGTSPLRAPCSSHRLASGLTMMSKKGRAQGGGPKISVRGKKLYTPLARAAVEGKTKQLPQCAAPWPSARHT